MNYLVLNLKHQKMNRRMSQMGLISYIKGLFKPAPQPENMKRKEFLRESLIEIVEVYLDDCQSKSAQQYYSTVLEEVKAARTMRDLLALELVIEGWVD
jgi:hypothetical protein